MKKNKAKHINEKLGVAIFDEQSPIDLKLIKYSKKEIKELCIDDLIQDGKWTNRLIMLVDDIEMGN